jgi:cysteine desulfurase
VTTYLDYASTTPVDSRVAAAMADALTRTDAFGNPSSAHALGLAARAAVERARAQVAALINAEPDAIIWTASATEANNLAILGLARRALRGLRVRGGQDRVHILTSRTEHKAVLNACKQLEREGCDVTYLKPRPDGRIDAAQVAEALRPDTALVSIMHVNNETGTINDVAAIGTV